MTLTAETQRNAEIAEHFIKSPRAPRELRDSAVYK